MACTSLPRFLVMSSLCVVGLAGIGVPAPAAVVQDRILAPASATRYVAIPNTVHPKAKLGTDLGPTASSTPLGMSIRFNMTDAQQAALDQLLANQQNPSSPQYHQWLTPAQYAAQFGMSSNDLAKVSAWLSSQGFTVTSVANGGTFITFDGTVGRAQTAFATSIHNISVDGETHFANVANVSVPSAFAGTVADVTGLHDFRLKPRMHTSAVKPEFTSSISNNHYLAPGDIYTIYNVSPALLSAGGAGIGTGVVNCHSVSPAPCGDIAVTGMVDIYPADIAAFRSAAGLSAINLTIQNAGLDPGYPGVCNTCRPNQGDLEESSIDLEWSGAMAPSAAILFVTGKDVSFNSMTYAIDNNVAPIVTTSYGNCEAAWGTSEMLTLNPLFKQATVQGQTVIAASADTGATDCDPQTVSVASEGLAVDFPASSPYVTGVGGTQLNEGITTGATAYWGTANGAVGQGSAQAYIPEAAWNDESYQSFGGGGGGPSAFFTKPAWQVGTPADAARDVPDLALDASLIHDGLLFCMNTAAAQGAESCGSGFRVSTSNDGLLTGGGTSFDSQMFGGMLALVEQKIGSRIGNANPTIYALANNASDYMSGAVSSPSNAFVFNDVTVGNNAMPCTAGTPNCPNGGTEGFNAGLGYDLTTGWGSVNLANLAVAWTKVTPLGSGSLGTNFSATTLSASPASVTSGAIVTLTATVTGSAGTPTGTVTFLANNVALPKSPSNPVTVVALNGTTATATYSWTTSCSNLGQQVMSAYYSGDTTNYQGSVGGANLTSGGASSVSPVEVQVATNSCPDFSVSPSNSTVTVATGTSAIPGVTITVTPIDNFTGTVVFTATGLNNNLSGYIPLLSFSPTSVNITSSTAQTTTLNISSLVVEANLQSPSAPGTSRTPAQRIPGATPWYAAGSGVAIASMLLLVLPHRRRLGGLLLVALAIALVGGSSGCASSQTGPPSSTTTTSSDPSAGVYQVNVVGKYTNSNGEVSTHYTTVTYTVN